MARLNCYKFFIKKQLQHWLIVGKMLLFGVQGREYSGKKLPAPESGWVFGKGKKIEKKAAL